MTDLILYDQACTALDRAANIDEVRDVMNKADAIRHYARQAKNRELEIKAAKIRMRAERRLWQLRAADKSIGRVAKGGRPYQDTTRSETEQVDLAPTLEELGIDRKLSARADKMAALPAEQFETIITKWETGIRAENERVTTDLLRGVHKESQAANRRDLAQALADTSDQLLTGRKVPAIYLDPAWARKAGIGDRAYENHYPTEKWQSIIEIMKKAATRLQPNAWAFIWIPRPHMLALHPVPYTIATDDGATHVIEIKTPLIWAIARALGCTDYSTCFVWTKTDEDHPDEHGTFLLVKDQDEILCLYKKGDGLPKPAMENIYGSNHRERSRPLGHSVKPPFYRKMIADMVGCDREGRPLPVLELFARHDEQNPLPENWEAWGNESKSSDGLSESLSGTLNEGVVQLRAASPVEPGPSDSESDNARVIEDSPSEYDDILNHPESEGGRPPDADDLAILKRPAFRR